jgi:hypothetical protein
MNINLAKLIKTTLLLSISLSFSAFSQQTTHSKNNKPSATESVNVVANDVYPFDEHTSFTPIYNHQNLGSWTIQGKGFWSVEQGEIVGRQDPSEKTDSWLFTMAEWDDFVLELEFNLPEKANSGVGIRMPKDSVGDPDVHGYEVQISDLPQRKLTGSLLHHVESKGNNLHNPNQWNHLAIICEGEHIRVYLNKQQVFDENVKGSKKGRIGLQVPKEAEFSKQVVRFRNLKVKDLTPIK